MIMHEFYFDRLGNFEQHSSSTEYKIDDYYVREGTDYAIEDGDDGYVRVIAPDHYTRREIQYFLLDYYNTRARGLVSSIALLDKEEDI
jgi:hypothetical protein